MANLSDINENVKIVKLRFLGAKTDLVNFDGHTPSEKCIELYDEVLQKIAAPKTLKTQSASSSTKSDIDVTTVIPIKQEMVGRIIGKGGSVIKRLTDDYNVKMSFGQWKEKANEAREVEPKMFTAVMIRGLISNVERVIPVIKDIVKTSRAK